MKRDFLVSANGRIVRCETFAIAQEKIMTLRQFGIDAKLYYSNPIVIIGNIGEA